MPHSRHADRLRAHPVQSESQSPTLSLQQVAKLLFSESGITNNAAHREGVDGVVPRDRHDAAPVRHDDVFALTGDSEAGFFQGTDGVEVVYAGNFRQG